jgi:hypothetical protein
MKRIAIFVEGQCEQLFIENLIKEIAGTKHISIIKQKASGGRKKGSRNFTEITAEAKNAQYFILIIDCSTDNRVKSDILEQYESLSNAGYETIIGIRDVYPEFIYDEIPKLRHKLMEKIPAGKITVLFILGVMEFESWLIAEYTHFPKIDSNITIERIKQELKIDPINDDISQRDSPSKDLSDIYWLANIDYDKSLSLLEKIISLINYQHLKKNISQRFDDLHVLFQRLDLFFGDS